MQIIQSGKPFPFDYTAFDERSDLFVSASIFDVTGTPFLVQNVVMSHVFLGCYVGMFTGSIDRQYAIIKAVYTDGTYSTPDPNRAPGTDTVQCLDILSISSGEAADLVNKLFIAIQILNGHLSGIEAEVEGHPQLEENIQSVLLEAIVTDIIDLSC